MEKVNRCGECIYHKPYHHRVNDGTVFNNSTEWYCNNKYSENYTEITEYNDTCGDFEERSEE